MKYEYIEQQMYPRHKFGVDWGKESKTLVHLTSDGPDEEKWLIWFSGGSYWSGMGGNSYCPSRLQIVHKYNRAGSNAGSEGGRLSKKKIEEAAMDIDREFGEGTAAMIDLKKTLVIFPDER